MSNSTKPHKCPLPNCNKRCAEVDHLRQHIRDKHHTDYDACHDITFCDTDCDTDCDLMAHGIHHDPSTLPTYWSPKNKKIIEHIGNFDVFTKICEDTYDRLYLYDDIYDEVNELFEYLCCNGLLEESKWLYYKYPEDISISYTFKCIFESNQLQVTKWLLTKISNIDYVDFDDILIELCRYEDTSMDMIKWITDLVMRYCSEPQEVYKKVFEQNIYGKAYGAQSRYENYKTITGHEPTMGLDLFLKYEDIEFAYALSHDDVLKCKVKDKRFIQTQVALKQLIVDAHEQHGIIPAIFNIILTYVY